MNLEKLKDTARKYEQREDWRKAIDAYQRVIQHFDSGREADADLTIYNRVGDLQLKLNDPGSAVQSYERAAELYAEQGFLNNAIALCGKVLRVNPGRVQVYLHLAHLHARKNVVSEAKRNLIEYMERMNTLGKLDEAFGQVKSFADQHSANQDIRLMLVELLRAASRTEEAQEQLERIASELEARGDRAGARKTRERIHAIDSPDDEPAESKNDLIFLETGFEPPRQAARRPAPVAEEAEEPPVAPAPVEGLEVVGGGPVPDAIESDPERVAGLDNFEPPPIASETVDTGVLADLQPSTFEPSGDQVTVPQLDGLVLDGAGELAGPDDLVAASNEEEESFAPLDLAMDPGTDDELTIISGPSEIHLESALEDEPSSLDAALAMPAEEEPAPPDDILADDSLSASVQFVDDFDVGAPIELHSHRDEAADLVEQEEPLFPSEFAAEAAGPGTAWPEPELPPAPVEAGALSDLDVADLEDRILDDPDSAALHRALGDRLAREGDLGRAVEEYVLGITAFERDEAWLPALDAVDALLALEPDAIRHQQKRVELAYRSGDRSRLLGAYLGLAESLVRAEALDKAVAVYQRVLEHDPENRAAREALAWLQTMSAPEAPVQSPPPAPAPERRAEERPPYASAPSAAPAASPVTPASSDFVDLGSMVIDSGEPRDTRMRIDGERPTGDEQKDFQETLEQFKRGIEANLGTEDYEAHYDLGVAFKEMGLLEEAIAEFQKALRAPNGRLRTSEALGVTFFEKGQYAIAETILRRAVDALEGGDDEKIGLLYWLGRACESQHKNAEARQAYERALAVDIRFMDLNERIRKLAVGRGA